MRGSPNINTHTLHLPAPGMSHFSFYDCLETQIYGVRQAHTSSFTTRRRKTEEGDGEERGRGRGREREGGIRRDVSIMQMRFSQHLVH